MSESLVPLLKASIKAERVKKVAEMLLTRAEKSGVENISRKDRAEVWDFAEEVDAYYTRISESGGRS